MQIDTEEITDTGLIQNIPESFSGIIDSRLEIPSVLVGQSDEANQNSTDVFEEYNGFSITFDEGGESNKTFSFSLLPAVDDGNETTSIPEIKPGVLKKTSMKIKRFAIPGSKPVYQNVGIENTIFQCVGLMIGDEGFNKSSNDRTNPYSINNSFDAYNSALTFDRLVVQQGHRCILTLISGAATDQDKPLKIIHNCLIQGFRYFVTRSDRVWYSLELVILDYAVPTSNSQTDDEDDIEAEEDEESN